MVETPAKINLGLAILERRPDLTHSIHTVFQAVDLCDRVSLTCRSGTGVALTSTDPTLPTGSSNLAVRAASAFLEAAGIRAQIEIHLAKQIPVGAGLGGGSSNAAGVLWGLNALFDRPLSQARLQALAAQLGADVAFFLEGGTCVGEGRGELLTPIPGPSPAIRCLLVTPEPGVATADAYSWFAAEPAHRRRAAAGWRAPRLAQGWLASTLQVVNALEPPVFARRPDIAGVRRQLTDLAVCALMSGSGSSVFGLFDSPADAGRIARQPWPGPSRVVALRDRGCRLIQGPG